MTRKKQILWALAFTGALVLVLAVVKFFQVSSAIAEGKKRGQPPVAVTTVSATKQVWPRTLSAVGSLVATQGATLSADVQGRVTKINFDSGSDVEEGQVLVELDTSVEQAELNSALAELELAESNIKRQRALRSRNVNSQSDLDDAEASLLRAKAEVERLKAVIAKKNIVAPFAGRTGIRLVNVGELLSPGTEVVSLQSYHKLFGNFSLPQDSLMSLSVGLDVSVTVDDLSAEPFKATLTAIESEINPITRNIGLQATLDNGTGKLRPGMFATFTVELAQSDEVISIPNSSISYAPYGNSVYVVDKPSAEEAEKVAEDSEAKALPTARAQVVNLGRRRGDLIAVISGLKEGDEIVSSGAFKVRPGVSLIVNNSVVPGANPNPTPADT